jgi:hypothetical protein
MTGLSPLLVVDGEEAGVLATQSSPPAVACRIIDSPISCCPADPHKFGRLPFFHPGRTLAVTGQGFAPMPGVAGKVTSSGGLSAGVAIIFVMNSVRACGPPYRSLAGLRGPAAEYAANTLPPAQNATTNPVAKDQTTDPD